MSTVSAEHLTKRYGSITAVDDLSFTLTPGSVTGFIGANGAGKTTTLRMLVGLARPTSGVALIDGVPYHRLERPLAHVGTVLEPDSFHPGRRARDHLRVVASTLRLASDRVDAVLEEVDLTSAASRRVGGFSLGMRQRLSLATALIGDPRVLILDEPMNGLDPDGVLWLRQLIRRLADDQRTVLVSSHVLSELSSIVDEVLLIDHGRLLTHTAVADHTDLESMYLTLTHGGASR